MAVHPPGPYLVKIPYVVAGISHEFVINCDVVGDPAIGSDPNDVNMETKGAVAKTLSQAVNTDLWPLLRQFWSNTVLASAYTLVKCRPENNDVVFISGAALFPINGGAAAAPVLASQLTLTWYSALGNLAKVVMLEHSFPRSDRVSIGATGEPVINDFLDYVSSDDNIIMARDRSFPVAGLNASFGQNEKVFNRRYRS